MSMKTILAALVIVTTTLAAKAQEARVTDEQDLRYIMQTHPETQSGPLAAMLATGKTDRVKSIRVIQTKSTKGAGCDLTFFIESELNYGTRSELNGLCIPDGVFKNN